MLYIVGTPIGNLGDITLRALETLKIVDFICAEDTRVTSKLLSHFEIKKPLISYYEHNKLERGPQIIEKLLRGENGALVSDAGMPGISDPGEHLVKLCIENNVQYTVVPGPVAFVTGAVLSGFSTKSITFMGFIPDDKKDAAKILDKIKKSSDTVALYESPHNLRKTLQKLNEIIPGRAIALARELTKIHEEVIRGTASELITKYAGEDPRGEYVLLIDGSMTEEVSYDSPMNSIDTTSSSFAILFSQEVDALVMNGMKRNEALKEVGKKYGISRNDAYTIIESIKA